MDRAPAGFLSYARLDDEADQGYITQLRERLENEVRLMTGEDFEIFQDHVSVRWGQEWKARLDGALSTVSFLIPILTPRFFKSDYCQQEVEAFLERERLLGRSDLVLPIYYVECLVLEQPKLRAAHPWAGLLATRQYVDWRDLRLKSFKDFKDRRVRTRLAAMAEQIRDAALAEALSEPPDLGWKGQGGPKGSEWSYGLDDPLESLVLTRGPRRSPDAREALGAEPAVFHDFVLQVSRSGQGEYVLRVLASPAGEGEARLEEDYVRLVIETMGGLDSGRFEALGESLFRLLFPPLVQSLFEASLGSLEPDQSLRLSLLLGSEEDPAVTRLWSLPWEYLFHPETGEFLGLGRQCLLVRRFDLPLPSPPPVRVGPFRLLVLALEPWDLAPLDLTQEIVVIEQAFAGTEVEIVVLSNPTLEDLGQVLSGEEYHGLHLSGHGSLDRQGLLYFSGTGGGSRSVTGWELAQVLHSCPSLRLAVLNAGYSGSVAPWNPIGGVATALLQVGLSAVIGFQSNVSDRDAITFSETFYRRLAAGEPVELAVLEGRQAIRQLDPTGAEWGSPVLYMRVPDGRLIQ